MVYRPSVLACHSCLGGNGQTLQIGLRNSITKHLYS
jgi:uncharacterized protein